MSFVHWLRVSLCSKDRRRPIDPREEFLPSDGHSISEQPVKYFSVITRKQNQLISCPLSVNTSKIKDRFISQCIVALRYQDWPETVKTDNSTLLDTRCLTVSPENFYNMGDFCEGVPLWSKNLTWHNSWPQFTDCFQEILLLIPCGWLWLASPFYIYYLLSLTTKKLQMSVLFTLKLFLSGCLMLLYIVRLFFELQQNMAVDTSSYGTADIVGPAAIAVTLFLTCMLMVIERKKDIITSGVLFIFWVLLALTAIVPLFSKILLQEYKKELLDFSIFLVSYIFSLAEVVLHCFARNIHPTEKPCPERDASFLSRLVFWWSNGLMFQGYRKPLTEEDVFEVHPRQKSRAVVPIFQANWNAESNKHQREQSQSLKYEVSADGDALAKLVPSVAKKTKKKTSLFKVLLKTFGWELLLSQMPALFQNALYLINPLILGQLIIFIEDASAERWKGYIYALSLFVSTVLQSILSQQVYHQSLSLGLRIRASIISSVFKKALTMNKLASRDITTGSIVNLMSVDAQNILMSMNFFFMLWCSPLLIAASLYLLFRTVGVSMYAGLGFLSLLFILNTFLLGSIERLQGRIMSEKDNRLKVVNEVLDGIKVLKLYAWEMAFKEKIQKIREIELNTLWKMNMITSVQTFSWTVAPYCIALVTFVTYIFMDSSHHLDAQTAFVAISLLNVLRIAVNMAPVVLSDCVRAIVSVRRVGHFLDNHDLDMNSVSHDASYDDAITIKDGTFTWNEDMPPVLRSIDLQVPDGSLVAVVGPVGAGKSSLVGALLGHMTKLEGSVNTRGKIAYVPQQAWIQNDTLQNNILFGKSMNKSQYSHVIQACALEPDIKILPGGNMTEIGEKGINLSGGQKQRISLARAVYNDANIYILDDPLSAVDSHVGKHIFQEVIGNDGMLKGKTRILVTHSVHFLPQVDVIVVMNDGRISEMASYNELLSHNGPFSQFLMTYFVQHSDNSEDEDSEVEVIQKGVLERLASVQPVSSASTEGDDMPEKVMKKMHKEFNSQAVAEEGKASTDGKLHDVKAPVDGEKLIEEETVEEGKVKWSVYATYAKALGVHNAFIMISLYLIYQAGAVGANIWLSRWTANPDLNNQSLLSNSSERRHKNDYYLTFYGVFGICQALAIVIFAFLHGFRSTQAARTIHRGMLDKILRAPMFFFDTTPLGRIINRFSQDISTIDSELKITCEVMIDCASNVLGTFVVISYTTPYFIAAIVPLGIIYFLIQRFYIATSRQLRRLETKNRSPIYSHFGESVSGASVIRAYGVTDRFILESERRVDLNQQMAFAGFITARWMALRLECLGALIVLLASILAVVTKESVTGGIVGLSVTYALEVTANLNWMVQMSSALETQVVSVERVKEYTEIPQEAAFEIKDTKPRPEWPEMGGVDFNWYSMRYRLGLNLVLENITCSIGPGQKVGIVGRTGAGKSSLALALFRLTEPAAGEIKVDGMKISQLGLHDLRAKLTILPQDPVLFAGSLRMNIDPFNQYTDKQIWSALEHAHLKTFVNSRPETILYDCGEGGENLSIGQRQLLCLARTLLRKTKVLVLDEATAAVDMETDDLIQQTIRSEFKDCTVITIAHRLNTIIDYDKILVLDQGHISQFGSPETLLQDTDGIFYKMAKDAGIL